MPSKAPALFSGLLSHVAAPALLVIHGEIRYLSDASAHRMRNNVSWSLFGDCANADLERKADEEVDGNWGDAGADAGGCGSGNG